MYVLVSEGELICVREIQKFMKKAIGRIRENEKGKRTRESEHVGICECRTTQKAQNTLKQKNSVRRGSRERVRAKMKWGSEDERGRGREKNRHGEEERARARASERARQWQRACVRIREGGSERESQRERQREKETVRESEKERAKKRVIWFRCAGTCTRNKAAREKPTIIRQAQGNAELSEI